MHHVLDHLDDIETTVPGLAGRVDWTKVAAVGHSLGGHTVGMLCGMTVTNAQDGTELDLRDERIVAGVIMAGPGAGEDLAGIAAPHYPDLAGTGFSTMTKQALVVAGDQDHNPMVTNRDDWRSDAYHRSPREQQDATDPVRGRARAGRDPGLRRRRDHQREPGTGRSRPRARLGLPTERAERERPGMDRRGGRPRRAARALGPHRHQERRGHALVLTVP